MRLLTAGTQYALDHRPFPLGVFQELFAVEYIRWEFVFLEEPQIEVPSDVVPASGCYGLPSENRDSRPSSNCKIILWDL